MIKLRAYILTVLVSALALPQASRATVAPPLAQQTKQLVQLFTGFFDNSQQVANDKGVPLVTISTCSVQPSGTTESDETQYVYLEQKSSAFERIRFYTFNQGNSTVNASIRNFVNSDILSGLCNKPKQQRTIDINNVIPTSCDLVFTLESDRRYTANNATKDGCPTSTGGKVVSTLTLSDRGIDSLDQIFDDKGNLLVSTPIKFDRISPIPEPSLTFGVLTFGILVGMSKRYQKK